VWPRGVAAGGQGPGTRDGYGAQPDGRTDGHQTITLRFPIDAASAIMTTKAVALSIVSFVLFKFYVSCYRGYRLTAAMFSPLWLSTE